MRTTRGLSSPWSHLPKERRAALGSLALLVALLSSVILYQRFTAQSEANDPSTVSPGVSAPTVPSDVVGTGVGEAPAVAGQAPAVAAPPPQLIRPLAGNRQLLQGYGFTYSDLFGDYRQHTGVDYGAAAGEAVLAAATGKVSRIDDDPAYGRVLELDHGNGFVTRYGSLGEVKVGLNATVQAGTLIAQVNASNQPHLHFEVLVNGSPVDPTPYLKP